MIKQVQTSKDSCLYRISLAYHHYRATCLEVGHKCVAGFRCFLLSHCKQTTERYTSIRDE
jgi:hypothetical protein